MGPQQKIGSASHLLSQGFSYNFGSSESTCFHGSYLLHVWSFLCIFIYSEENSCNPFGSSTIIIGFTIPLRLLEFASRFAIYPPYASAVDSPACYAVKKFVSCSLIILSYLLRRPGQPFYISPNVGALCTMSNPDSKQCTMSG